MVNNLSKMPRGYNASCIHTHTHTQLQRNTAAASVRMNVEKNENLLFAIKKASKRRQLLESKQAKRKKKADGWTFQEASSEIAGHIRLFAVLERHGLKQVFVITSCGSSATRTHLCLNVGYHHHYYYDHLYLQKNADNNKI